MQKRELQPGDIVQLDPEYGNGYGGLLLVVDEPKDFGCQGHIYADTVEPIENSTTYKGRAFLRPTWDKMEYVGKLAWIKTEENI